MQLSPFVILVVIGLVLAVVALVKPSWPLLPLNWKMKNKLTLLLAVAFFAISLPVSFVIVGCKTAPSERVIAVQTLKSVGQSAEAAVALSAQLYRDGKITAKQARDVIDFYDTKFQPAFRVAVTAVQSNLDSFASAEILSLANGLSQLLIQIQIR